MNAITRVLDDVRAGKPGQAAELLPLVYAELRALAAARIGPGLACRVTMT